MPANRVTREALGRLHEQGVKFTDYLEGLDHGDSRGREWLRFWLNLPALTKLAHQEQRGLTLEQKFLEWNNGLKRPIFDPTTPEKTE